MSRSRHVGVPLVACWLLVSSSAVAVAVAPRAAEDEGRCEEISGGALDANGDGNPDLVVGSPREDVARVTGGKQYADAGSVTVVHGDADGVLGGDGARSIGQEQLGLTSEAGDRFGAALAFGDVDGNGCADLIVGEPGEDAGAGQVVVIPADEDGLDLAARLVLRQGRAGVAGRYEAGDRFGSVVGWWSEGLWIGAPYEDLPGAQDAGVVTTYQDGTSGIVSRELAQGVAGIPGRPEKGDHFGRAVAPGQAVGASGEDVTGVGADAGTVALYDIDTGWGSAVSGSSAGDRLGTAVAGDDEVVLAGAPGDDIGKEVDAGSVRVVVPFDATVTLADANRKPLAGNRFGASVVDSELGFAVGAPDRDVQTARDAGLVVVLWVDNEDEPDGVGWYVEVGRVLSQASNGGPGKPERDDAFGASLGVGVGGRLVVGAPGETDAGRAGAGAVTVVTGRAKQTLAQSTAGVPGAAEAGDGFGAAVARR